MNGQRLVRFGTFEFDLESHQLRNDGRRVPLQGQPAQILAHLLTSPGHLGTREELRRTLWPDDTFVDFDAALNVAINKIRQALNDSASAPRYIETIPKRGYRFLADVHAIERVDAPAPAGEPPRVAGSSIGLKKWRWGAAVLAVVALPMLSSGIRLDSVPATPRSVAVLPFRPLVADSRDEALEVGLAEAVIIRLGQLKQLRVPSIYAVGHYAKRQPDPRIAGRELGVDAVLEGSLLRHGGKVRLSTRLLDVEKGTTLWAQQWDVPWTDVFTVQDTMATEVTRALAVRLGAGEQAFSQAPPTTVEAYDAYLRARHLLRRRTIGDSKRAAELLEEAVRRDPISAEAYASLGFAYISVPLLGGASEPFASLGRQAAQRALELDPTLAEPHSVLGRIKVHFDWDIEGAHRESRRAIELEPDNPFVLHCYALILADDGQFDEALALADRALALDPTSVIANRDKAIILYLARRYEESIRQGRRTLELDPYSAGAYNFIAQAYEQLGLSEQAAEAYITPFTFSEQNQEIIAALRAAARRGGAKEFWRERLRIMLKRPQPSSVFVAAAFVRIGEHDRAFEWLEKLYAERGAWIRSLKVNPVWDPLRADPRFDDLLRRANLAPEDVLLLSQRRPAR